MLNLTTTLRRTATKMLDNHVVITDGSIAKSENCRKMGRLGFQPYKWSCWQDFWSLDIGWPTRSVGNPSTICPGEVMKILWTEDVQKQPEFIPLMSDLELHSLKKVQPLNWRI